MKINFFGFSQVIALFLFGQLNYCLAAAAANPAAEITARSYRPLHQGYRNATTTLRRSFVDEIRSFEQIEHITLDELLNGVVENDMAVAPRVQLRKIFFSKPNIINYLSRDSSQVVFLSDYPALDLDMDEASEYELLIYNSSLATMIPYRGKGNEYQGDYQLNQFYSRGSPKFVGTIPRLRQALSPQVFTYGPNDIYEIRDTVASLLTPIGYNSISPNNKFLLFPMGKDDHAATFIVILAENNQPSQLERRPLAVIFINSWNNPQYTNYLKVRWNMNDQVKNIPWIDASHNIQLDKGDGNCALYSINFLASIQDFLANESNRSRVYNSALHTDTDGMQHIFQEELKPYLPFYYDINGETLPNIARKNYHLRQRWDIGNIYLKSQDFFNDIDLTLPITRLQQQQMRDEEESLRNIDSQFNFY
ncbi:MAG: hypothetical protein HQK53_09545 [Oligoflexia bacterium]|nr:hypothetical protein [Oligoflexia bacterium]